MERIITSVLNYIPNGYFSSRLINCPVEEQLADFLSALFLSGALDGLATLS